MFFVLLPYFPEWFFTSGDKKMLENAFLGKEMGAKLGSFSKDDIEVYKYNFSTPGKGPVKYNNTPGKGPVKYNNTPGKEPVKYNDTPGKGPVKYNNTPGKAPVKYKNTPGKGPVKYNNTRYETSQIQGNAILKES